MNLERFIFSEIKFLVVAFLVMAVFSEFVLCIDRDWGLAAVLNSVPERKAVDGGVLGVRPGIQG
jgi:hypothetical protein